MEKFYVLADLKREPSEAERKAVPVGGQMYAGKVKTIIEAETWKEAMEEGKKIIAGSLKNGVIPFQWAWKSVKFVEENGESDIYRKYKTITKLTYFRVQSGLTQQKLADSAGVNIRLIQKVEGGEAEAGNLTAKNLLSIAGALGVDAKDII